MGAATAMIEAGATPRFGRMGANRFDAYVALSPQGVGYMFAAGAWGRVTKPVLMITGTRDQGADGDWRTRLSAFEGLPQGRKRLAVIPGATHLQLSGGERQMGATLGALAGEFLALPVSGRRAASAIGGVDIRDK
jgi:pimeloyl-ACP methyl ester carboxylesterase